MPKYSVQSTNILRRAHPDLIRLFNEVILYTDCKIICSYRDKEDQDLAYKNGRSQLKWPDSKHNKTPSLAVDVLPYFSVEPHIRWDDINAFHKLAGYVLGIAGVRGIKITWGGCWEFSDLPHYQLGG